MKSLIPFNSNSGKKFLHIRFGIVFVLVILAGGFTNTFAKGGVNGVVPGINANNSTADSGTSYVNKSNGDVKAGTYKQQAISFKAIGQKQVGDADIDPAATSTSGLKVNYSSTNPDVAIIVDGKIRITGAGMTLIIVSQEGDDKFDAAISVIRPLRVVAAPVK